MKRVVYLFVLISAMLLSSQTVKADWLIGSGYFNIETHTDHFTVKLLVADLVGRDTWMKDGYIRAYANDDVWESDYIDIAPLTKTVTAFPRTESRPNHSWKVPR